MCIRDRFCRRLADASGRAVIVGDAEEASSAAGAARLAAAAAGADLPPVREGAVRVTPDAERAGIWDRRWHEYQDLLLPLQQLYRTWPPADRE